MKEFNAKLVEEYGYKAHRSGFFREWQRLTSSISENEDINYADAAEKAFNHLKLVGSE
ncbi:hypothetical protein OAO15_00205 [bacterium]|jgi:hypothetical protein|nr:hypothetical protein [bacterium]